MECEVRKSSPFPPNPNVQVTTSMIFDFVQWARSTQHALPPLLFSSPPVPADTPFSPSPSLSGSSPAAHKAPQRLRLSCAFLRCLVCLEPLPWKLSSMCHSSSSTRVYRFPNPNPGPDGRINRLTSATSREVMGACQCLPSSLLGQACCLKRQLVRRMQPSARRCPGCARW